jgi:predicted small secreted protein
MIMIRISKMKKVVFLIITLLMCLTLTSCDDTIAYNGGVDVTIPDEIVEKLVYTGEIPVFHFSYDGDVNVADFSTKSK